MWYVKDHFYGKVYLKTKNQQFAVDFANYYNRMKKVPFTKYKLSCGTNIMFSKYDVDINDQFGKRGFLELYPKRYESPFVENNKKYTRQHLKYLERKHNLVTSLCYKYHLWPYASDGHKLCGFDW